MDDYDKDLKLVCFSGVISNLYITHDEKDLVIGSALKNTGRIAVAGLAIAGVAGAAATGLQSSVGSEISVQYFRCNIGNKEVMGCFSVVFFDNGEFVDIVAEKKDSNIYYCHAVRRPIDHRLWLPLYCERGTKAQRKSAINFAKWTTLIACVIPLLFLNLTMIDLNNIYSYVYFFSGMTLFPLITFLLLYKLYGGNKSPQSVLAEKIFMTLGYKKAAYMDMNIESAQFLKDCLAHGGIHYIEESQQFHQMPLAPCVYHYCEAPELPESSKLKE